MGQLSLACTAYDGTHLYGLALATKASIDYYVLVQSNTNPSSEVTPTWSFLSAIPRTKAPVMYFSVKDSLCQVDKAGVFWLISSTTGPVGAGSAPTQKLRGLSWDPLGIDTTGSNSTGSGAWTVLDSTSTMDWSGSRGSSFFTLGSTPVQAYMSADALLNFAVYNATTKLFTQQALTWNLATVLGSGFYSYGNAMGYGNGTLFLTTSYSPQQSLYTLPLNSTTAPIPASNTSGIAASIAIDPVKGCNLSTEGSVIKVVEGTVYIFCATTEAGASPALYQYTSTGVLQVQTFAPLQFTVLPTTIQFITPNPSTTTDNRPQGQQSWIYIEVDNLAYSISFNSTSVSWSKIGNAVINEAYGISASPPTTTITQPTSSNDKLSGAGIGGIVVGVLIICISFAYWVRFKRRQSSRNGAAKATKSGDLKEVGDDKDQMKIESDDGETQKIIDSADDDNFGTHMKIEVDGE